MNAGARNRRLPAKCSEVDAELRHLLEVVRS